MLFGTGLPGRTMPFKTDPARFSPKRSHVMRTRERVVSWWDRIIVWRAGRAQIKDTASIWRIR